MLGRKFLLDTILSSGIDTSNITDISDMFLKQAINHVYFYQLKIPYSFYDYLGFNW